MKGQEQQEQWPAARCDESSPLKALTPAVWCHQDNVSLAPVNLTGKPARQTCLLERAEEWSDDKSGGRADIER